MNKYRTRLVFDYFDQRDYAIVCEYGLRYPSSITVNDEYPAFWIDIDTGDRSQNLALADAILTEMQLEDKMNAYDARDALSSAWIVLNMAERYINEAIAENIFSPSHENQLRALAEKILDHTADVNEIGETVFGDD